MIALTNVIMMSIMTLSKKDVKIVQKIALLAIVGMSVPLVMK